MIESHQKPPQVEFDPSNEEHLAAVVWMFFYGKQHPTLRFRLDPTKHTTVREHMLHSVLKYWIPLRVQQKVETEVAELARKISPDRQFVCYENKENAVVKSKFSVRKVS